ncbi:MAG: adenosylcobinamide-GDP ribazoletransferase [Chlorobiaceae bacterium]|jgi:adenosylcobinamide-GDP ribazoletransferase|nr:adenosylcobinamide-GDP ribazoletransferase [Chlorobiaceae bacterium]NTV16517.1 adenosylcobinamide-GDP ribazoletransferase [Chlorobiaceae bacterium]
MLSDIVTAVRTLTVIPVPGRDTETFSRSLYWFPLVGLLLGLIQAALGYFGSRFAWNELSALLVILGGIVLTRGMHADGLADLADGFWGGRTREAALKIMKDPNVGSFGAIALSGIMLLKWVILLKLVGSGAFEFIAAGVLLARWTQVLLASSLPYAREEGGTAQAFVSGAGVLHIIVTSGLTLFFLLTLLHADLYALVLVVSVALSAAVFTGVLSYRKIGGVTGDVLGAGSEVTEVFVWTAAALYSVVNV